MHRPPIDDLPLICASHVVPKSTVKVLEGISASPSSRPTTSEHIAEATDAVSHASLPIYETNIFGNLFDHSQHRCRDAGFVRRSVNQSFYAEVPGKLMFRSDVSRPLALMVPGRASLVPVIATVRPGLGVLTNG
jgi:hypothetical protein